MEDWKDTTPSFTRWTAFFFSDNSQLTNKLYSKNLGIKINKWGLSRFESRDMRKHNQI